MKSPLEEKLQSLLAAELRRQGVPQSQLPDLLPRLASRTSVRTTAARPSSDDDSSSSGGNTTQRDGALRVLEMDLSGQRLGDRVAMAVCEVLLKLSNAAAAATGGNSAAGSLPEGDVDTWRVNLRHNKLTERCVRHLALLLASCAQLASLDVSQNDFNKDGTRELLTAIADSPHGCEVMYDVGGTDTSGGDDDRSSREVRCAHAGGGPVVSPTAITDRYARDRSHAGPVMPTATGQPSGKKSGAAASEDTAAHHKHGSPRPPPPSAAAPSGKRASSPSIEFAMAPTNSSRQLSTLSLDSRQLRQQLKQPATAGTTASLRSLSLHEELDAGADPATLHGDSEAVDPLLPPPLPAPPQQQHQTRSPDRVHVSRVLRSPSTATATSVTSRSHFASGSAEALRRRREELFSRRSDPDEGTHNSNAEEQQQQQQQQRERPEKAPADTGVHERERGGGEPAAAHVGSSPFREASRPTDTTAAAAASTNHEPYEPNDQLDLTANLNPVLDSVLDLSALMDDTGEALKQPATCGGARSVWDIIRAYEEAADITTRRGRGGLRASGNSSRDGGNDGQHTDTSRSLADVTAKLPAALRGGDAYNALTVLNISDNRLKSLATLPSTLLRLDISKNELTSLSGVHQCKMLTVLNARRNQIRRISSLEHNLCLAHLFLGRNRIACVEGLAHLLLLETLDLTYNQLPTQGSLRALSLCGALRHLLIKENPFVATLKNQNYKPLIRNLCPTLLMLDEVKLGPSRYADAAQQSSSYLRQSTMIDARRPRVPTSSAEILLTSTHLPDNAHARSSRQGGANASRATTAATANTGRSGLGVRTAASHDAAQLGPRGADDGAEAEAQQQSMNLLHLLTRGVTPTNGYGDAARAAQTARSVAARDAQRRADEEKRKAREGTASGQPIRAEMVKKLAAASKRYLETTIVDRMASLQQHEEEDGQGPAGERGSDAAGEDLSSSPPPRRYVDALGESPIADLMVYTTAPHARGSTGTTTTAAAAATDEDIMRGYQPTRFRAPSAWGRGASKSKSKSKSKSASHDRPAGGLSASPSGRRSASTVAPGQRSRSRPAAVADATVEDVYLVGGPGGRGGGPIPSPAVSFAARHTTRPTEPTASPLPSRESERIDCSPIRCFDDSGLLRSFDNDSDETGRPPDRRRGELFYKPPQPLPRTSATTSAGSGAHPALQKPRPLPTYDIAASSVSAAHSKTVVPRDTRWQPQPAARPRNPRPAATDVYMPPQAPAPVHTDAEQRRRVQSWAAQLQDDAEAVQAALATVVQLLEAQRGKGLGAAESSTELPPTYLHERRRCVGIIQDSGMLHDTQVPMDVVVYYGLSKGELESGEPAAVRSTPAMSERHEKEREELLRRVRLLNDAKTCLRYMLLLIGNGRERLLQQYVDQVKASLAEGQDGSASQ